MTNKEYEGLKPGSVVTTTGARRKERRVVAVNEKFCALERTIGRGRKGGQARGPAAVRVTLRSPWEMKTYFMLPASPAPKAAASKRRKARAT